MLFGSIGRVERGSDGTSVETDRPMVDSGRKRDLEREGVGFEPDTIRVPMEQAGAAADSETMARATGASFRLAAAAQGVEGGPRIGRIAGTFAGDLETPAMLLPTRRGAPTHITPDHAESLAAGGPLAAQVSVVHFLEFPNKETLRSSGRGIHQFAGLRKYFVLSTLRDTLHPELSDKRNTKNSVHTNTPSGYRHVNVDSYMDTVLALKPDMFVALSDDVGANATGKRLDKSLQRTKLWTIECLARAKESDCHGIMLAPIVGGNSPDHRRRATEAARELQEVAGFAWTDFGTGESAEERLQAMEVSIGMLPAEKLRYAAGMRTVQEMLQCVTLGVDLFDSAHVHEVSSQGQAFTFLLDPRHATEKVGLMEGTNGHTEVPYMVNLKDEVFDKDPLPISPGCTCMACQEYSRQYIHHLLHSRELLAEVLLQVHNYHHFLRFMHGVRDSIRDGSFPDLQTAWVGMYGTEEQV